MTALTPPAHVSGTIRQLEWVLTSYTTTDDDNGPREGIPRKLNAWKADRYLIIKQDSLNGLFILKGDEGSVSLATAYLKTAKAAAQADYEARIRGEIQPDAEPQPGTVSSDMGMPISSTPPTSAGDEAANPELAINRIPPVQAVADEVNPGNSRISNEPTPSVGDKYRQAIRDLETKSDRDLLSPTSAGDAVSREAVDALLQESVTLLNDWAWKHAGQGPQPQGVTERLEQALRALGGEKA